MGKECGFRPERGSDELLEVLKAVSAVSSTKWSVLLPELAHRNTAVPAAEPGTALTALMDAGVTEASAGGKPDTRPMASTGLVDRATIRRRSMTLLERTETCRPG